MPSGVTPELRASLQAQNGSGILTRIPVYTGDKQHGEEVLPVFARAEVMLDSKSGLKGGWISFSEYQQVRADRARLPDAILPDFHEWLRLLTEESGFKCWIFRPGMLFGDPMEWWGDGCRRRTEHEGLDFAVGLLPGGGICNIQEGILIRSLAEGEVVAVLDDFIGKTVVVRHAAFCRSDGYVFHSLLSHIQPQVSRLDLVSRNQIVGTVGKSTNTGAPSHLHLTGAWIPETLVADGIRMDHIHPGFAPVVLVDFKEYLNCDRYIYLRPQAVV
jgi:hypothetical protein